MIRLAIDQGVAQQRAGAIATAAVGLVVVALVWGVCTFLQGFLAERASQGVAYDLRDLLFARLQRLSFSYYDKVATFAPSTRRTPTA